MSFEHIKNFKSLKGKLWHMSINDLTVMENKLIDQKQEIDEKIELINEIIRMKENNKDIPTLNHRKL